MEFIAHRGASAHAPENTLASFQLALKMGAKAIELDISQSKDGKLVVIHDSDLKRVAGKLERVESFTAQELKEIDVGSWFTAKHVTPAIRKPGSSLHADLDSGFRRNDGYENLPQIGPEYFKQGVPSLTEVFQTVKKKATLHIEIKGGCRFYPQIEEKLAHLLSRIDPLHKSFISSFDHEALYHFRRLDKKARIGYLLGRTSFTRAFKEMAEIGVESLNLDMKQVNARIVSQCHDRGLKVFVYTVNKLQDVLRLKKIGVDGVFTNFPELERYG